MQATLTTKQIRLLRTGAATEASRQLIDKLVQQTTPQAIQAAETGDEGAAQWPFVVRPTWREGRKREQNICAIMGRG